MPLNRELASGVLLTGARMATAGSLAVEPGNGAGPLPMPVLARGLLVTNSVIAGRRPMPVVVV